MRIGSMCTGYGGLDMALQQVLGGELAWVADPAPAASAVLAHHHPETPNLGDITTTDWATTPPVDVLTAGFPCQDISNAGSRAGIGGNRSGIWANVAHAIGVLRPRLVFLENVASLTVRGLDRVLADLAAVGFDAEWACVRASDVGAPHRRERWFCVAWPADTAGAGLQAWRQGRAGGAAVQDADLTVGGEWWQPAPGQAQIRRARADAGGRSGAPTPDPARDGWHEGRPQPAGIERRSDVAERGHVDWGPYATAIARWEHTTGRRAPAPTRGDGRGGAHRLNPEFVEWLMGLPAGHVTDPAIGLSRNQQLTVLGNGVVPAQGSAALRMLLAHTHQPIAA